MIDVRRLSKRYGDTLAVDDVSFSVETGTICGLLGPNGAGKSTTMNIMTGCLAATSGEVRYDGLEIYEDMEQVKRKIGYLPEQPPLYPDMTAREYLQFVGLAKGLSFEQTDQDTRAISAVCGIEEVLDRLIKNLSKGYKQRIGIAQALMGNPDYIILDEPTSGLDPLQIREIRDLVKRLSGERTILVSSHILSEIQLLCDQVVIISKGHIVANDTPEQLEAHLQPTRTIAATLLADEDACRAALAQLAERAAISFVSAGEGAMRATIESADGADLRAEVSRAAAAHSIALLEMSSHKASLEDIFVEVTEHASDSAATDAAGESPSRSTSDEKGGTPC